MCFPYSGRTRDEKYNERYHRVKRQFCGNIKKVFFFKLSYSEVRAFFTYSRLAHVLNVERFCISTVYIIPGCS